jgi:hypothetical protein
MRPDIEPLVEPAPEPLQEVYPKIFGITRWSPVLFAKKCYGKYVGFGLGVGYNFSNPFSTYSNNITLMAKMALSTGFNQSSEWLNFYQFDVRVNQKLGPFEFGLGAGYSSKARKEVHPEYFEYIGRASLHFSRDTLLIFEFRAPFQENLQKKHKLEAGFDIRF